jgi:hypothetical protein
MNAKHRTPLVLVVVPFAFMYFLLPFFKPLLGDVPFAVILIDDDILVVDTLQQIFVV